MASLVTQTAALATVPSASAIAVDAIGGVSYQRVKISQGDTGVGTEVTSAIGLWVTQATSNWTVQPSSQFTVSTIPTSQQTVSVTPTTQLTVSVTPTSALTIGLITSTSTLVSQYIATIPTSQITASVTPTSQFTVTTTPSSQMTVSVTPTSALTIGLITSTSTLISQFISVVPSSQWTVTSTPSSQATVSVTPTTQFTVTTTPSSVVNVTTTPSSVVNVTTTPSSSYTVAQGTVGANPWIFADCVNALYTVGGVVGTPVYTNISAASGSVTLAATGTSTTWLNSMSLFAGAAATVSLGTLSAAVLTTIIKYVIPAGATVTLPYSPVGWLKATGGVGIGIALSSAVSPNLVGFSQVVAM